MPRKKINYSIRATLVVSIGAFYLSGCTSSGPTKRSVDGEWKVSENTCSSDPSQPDKGDMTSVIRQKSNQSTSAQRQVKVSYLDKTILELENNYTRSGITGNLTTYENSTGNEIRSVKQALNRKQINAGFKQAIIDFFATDATIDGEKAISGCLYRGQ